MPKRPKTDSEALTEDETWALRIHLSELRFRTKSTYQQWCEASGFSTKLKKTKRARRQELRARESERAAAAAQKLKRSGRKQGAVIVDILDGRLSHESVPPNLLPLAEAMDTLGRSHETTEHFGKLVLHVSRSTDLVSSGRVIAEYPNNVHNTYIGALASLATHWKHWKQPATDWKPKSHNTRRQLGDLARHLLAEYPVPAFMDSVWFRRSRSQLWFRHLGSGNNIRTAQRLLIPLTKKMAHHFMQTPSDYTVEHAFRWGQVHGLGGGPRIINAIRATLLGRQFKNNEFWARVLTFFVRNPMLDPAHFGPIIDFIQNQKFDPTEVFVRRGVIERRDPPHPGFSMSKRRPETLLAQVEAWHRRLGKEAQAGQATWKPSGTKRLDYVEGRAKTKNMKRWTIHELLTSDELRAEGRSMRHCVATYAPSCAAGRTSVWSMRLETFEGTEPRLTIDLQPGSKQIREVRGKRNRYPTDKEVEILRRWAGREGLGIPDYVGH